MPSFNVQNAKALAITEGDVKTIHDKDNRLLWGRVAYSTKYQGDTSQQTYSGKNILPITPASSTGLTISYDASTGEFSVSGTPTTQYNDISFYTPVSIAAGTVVTASRYITTISGSAVRLTQIGLRDSGSDNADDIDLVESDYKTITTSKAITRVRVRLRLYANEACNFKVKVQLEIGNQSTSFEPYVGGIPSPNPSYPQDIQVVTGEQTVVVSDGSSNSQSYEVNLGKNMLDSTVYYSGTGAYSPSVGDTIPNAFSPNVTSAFADDQLSISTTVQWGGVILITRSLTPGTYHIGAKVTVPSGNNARVRYHILNNANKVLEVGDYGTTAAGSTKVYDWSITLGTGETCIALAIVTSTEGGGSITATDLQIEAGSTATTYAPYFTPIELCKIGTYQDYIYKSNGNWYKHAAIDKKVYDGTESWSVTTWSETEWGFYKNTPGAYQVSGVSEVGPIISNYFSANSIGDLSAASRVYYGVGLSRLNPQIFIKNKDCADTTAFQTWLSTHNTTVYYALAAPTDTQITDANLIAQLEAIDEWCRRAGYEQTVISVAPNLPLIVSRELI